jgi:predicted RNase H-like HicB family nuclease
MSKYEMIIYWSDEDKLFIAEIPELPGCMADGQSYQEAVSKTTLMFDLASFEFIRRDIDLF